MEDKEVAVYLGKVFLLHNQRPTPNPLNKEEGKCANKATLQFFTASVYVWTHWKREKFKSPQEVKSHPVPLGNLGACCISARSSCTWPNTLATWSFWQELSAPDLITHWLNKLNPQEGNLIGLTHCCASVATGSLPSGQVLRPSSHLMSAAGRSWATLYQRTLVMESNEQLSSFRGFVFQKILTSKIIACDVYESLCNIKVV